MKYITEKQSANLISHEMAFEAMSSALIAACEPASRVFPAVIAHGSDPANRFSLKSAADSDIAGVKIGFNWPSNVQKGIPSHNSVIALFDQDTGGIAAVIEAGVVNSYRTSGADAVACNTLARNDARVLAVFGAGNQAGYECEAILRIREIACVHVVTLVPAEAERFAQHFAGKGVEVKISDARTACQAADIIVTATPARAPLFEAAWVRPGTHVSSIGADSKGKQELPVELLRRASLFCDLRQQSLEIGEFQHIREHVAAGAVCVTQLGEVLSGKQPGRTSLQEITVFDTSGMALQDLYIGRRVLEAHTQSVDS